MLATTAALTPVEPEVTPDRIPVIILHPGQQPTIARLQGRLPVLLSIDILKHVVPADATLTIPSYTAAALTGEMVWTVPTLAAASVLAASLKPTERTQRAVDDDGGDGDGDDDDGDTDDVDTDVDTE